MEYRLGSSPKTNAPGVVKWAIIGYQSKRHRKVALDAIAKGWGIPEDAAKALLAGTVEYRVVDEAVMFEV